MTIKNEKTTIKKEILTEMIEYMERQCVHNVGDTYRKIVEMDYGCPEKRILDELYKALDASVTSTWNLYLPMYRPSSIHYVQYDADNNRVDKTY